MVHCDAEEMKIKKGKIYSFENCFCLVIHFPFFMSGYETVIEKVLRDIKIYF